MSLSNECVDACCRDLILHSKGYPLLKNNIYARHALKLATNSSRFRFLPMKIILFVRGVSPCVRTPVLQR